MTKFRAGDVVTVPAQFIYLSGNENEEAVVMIVETTGEFRTLRILAKNAHPRREWQPIETAPPNVDVLLYCPDRGCESNRARIEFGYASHGWRNEVANNVSHHPWATHWMPLPEPPS
jgi:hypothetical protein